MPQVCHPASGSHDEPAKPMRPLSDREKRTVRLGAGILIVYLAVFYGGRGFNRLERARAEHQKLVQTAQQLNREALNYQRQMAAVRQLRETFHIDPSQLSRKTLVAEANAAIQKLAGSIGIQLGPVRESSARPAAKELTAMQVEGVGPVPAVSALLHALETLGYPLVIDAVQMTPDNTKPGMVKVNLTIVILDIEQWKTPEARRA